MGIRRWSVGAGYTVPRSTIANNNSHFDNAAVAAA